jgi:starch-binding outer membrane protein, SusD/RagB family
MKKYILLLIMIFSIGACRKDFLEEKAVTTLTQDYYKTAEGLETLVKGTYQILRFKPDYNQGQYICGISSDVEVYAWSNADRIAMGSYSSTGWGSATSSSQVYSTQIPMLIGAIGGNVSEGAFPTINRCNVFLENYANLSSADQTKLAARKGEILFIRTYAYYLLTNTLGDVPLMLKSVSGLPANFAYTKEPMENIYKQIIGDLRKAVDLLPASVVSADLGRITKPAAAHLLAKLYLHRAQAANWQNSTQTHLKMLYKGSVSTDLDSCIYYSTLVIDQLKGNSIYGGLETDFAKLWKNVAGNYDRDACKEIILSAQYEPTQVYDGRYGNTLVHLYNSNYTTLRCGVVRTLMDYGRPYATAGPSDWGCDMYADRANDSRYYKTFLTDYFANNTTYNATTLEVDKGKTWNSAEAYYYNNIIKSASDANAVSGKIKILYKKTGLVYIENSKNQPLDSAWVVSQPFIMMARWMVGSPNKAGYFTKAGAVVTGFKPGAVDPLNPAVITNWAAQNRKIYYRISGDDGAAFGLDRGLNSAQYYMSPRKWLDVNRGTGTLPNNPGAIDVPLIRLAETYLIRAEAYGRKADYPDAITDLNILRKRAAYHTGETRSQVLMNYEPGVLTGTLSVPAGEKVSPYTVATDSYAKITIDGTEWVTGSPKAALENYPVEAATDADKFIQFIYNERARELIFEELTVEDLHNAGILYERVRDRDMMGAPATSTGTASFPFPDDDLNVALGANGTGKGQLQKFHTFKPWPQSFLDVLTDEQGNALDATAKAAYQNPGY